MKIVPKMDTENMKRVLKMDMENTKSSEKPDFVKESPEGDMVI